MSRFIANDHEVEIDAASEMPLLWVLRDLLGLTGTKYGCGIGQCGACTVLLDGEPVRSCQTALGDILGRSVITIEAIERDPVGAKVQRAWLEIGVIQCGYCQSGQIISATALLRRCAFPSDAEIDVAMAGNICRCGTYPRIRVAIREAAGA
jgi:isoquinoline 1-oxidoreductase alpha subunit